MRADKPWLWALTFYAVGNAALLIATLTGLIPKDAPGSPLAQCVVGVAYGAGLVYVGRAYGRHRQRLAFDAELRELTETDCG